ncbi:phosphopantetheine-binding protein [Streptomyces sp. MNU76]|uniref:phosphopantetheine-binding protein n=1 Tax=Streptomyces sp. MNU76 TaxID=2560026 RepID=UPI0035A93AB6
MRLEPSGPVEPLIAQTWAEVLGRDQFCADYDFFVLGGHSLMTLEVIADLRRSLGVVFSTRAVYRPPHYGNSPATSNAPHRPALAHRPPRAPNGARPLPRARRVPRFRPRACFAGSVRGARLAFRHEELTDPLRSPRLQPCC